MINKLSHCPECGAQWHMEDIYQALLAVRDDPNQPYYKGKTDEEMKESAMFYGWYDNLDEYLKHSPYLEKDRHNLPPQNLSKFSRVIGIQLAWDHPQHYDGVSYWQCPYCKTTWNRFTQQKEAI